MNNEKKTLGGRGRHAGGDAGAWCRGGASCRDEWPHRCGDSRGLGYREVYADALADAA